jgi:succinate dehydrogenase hydrophobic membrane anchor protein
MKTCSGASAISAALATGYRNGGCSAGPHSPSFRLGFTSSPRCYASPVPALLTILFVLALLAHAVVGMRSVLVDYVHTRARLLAAELLVRGAAVVLGGASVLAVLKLFLGR